jgi:hypothetical protein
VIPSSIPNSSIQPATTSNPVVIDAALLAQLLMNQAPIQPKPVTLPNGDVYVGSINSEGKPHGQGSLTYNKQEPKFKLYTGEFVNGIAQGKGRLEWKDGDIDEGDFVNGLLEGRGKRTEARGSFRQGLWVGGKLNGQGMLREANGNVYSGNFVNGNPDGYGKYDSPTHSFEGIFKNCNGWNGIKKDKVSNSTYYYLNGEWAKDVVDLKFKDGALVEIVKKPKSESGCEVQ